MAKGGEGCMFKNLIQINRMGEYLWAIWIDIKIILVIYHIGLFWPFKVYELNRRKNTVRFPLNERYYRNRGRI